MWAAFAALVVALLLVDLVAFGRRGEEIAFRRAVGWSIGWTVVGLGFAGFLWAWQGRSPAEEYLAGFVIEKSLSIDNLFVFALIFGYFAVPAIHQRRVIFWGIVGAIVLRALFILAGARCSTRSTTRSTSSGRSSSSRASGWHGTRTSRSIRSETPCCGCSAG